MEIYQLRTLMVVAREQHLTRAADILHISQPAVSGQIKSLEQELGLTLFERKHGGMELTKAATTLLPSVEKILAATAELKSEASRLSGQIIGKISLGVILNPTFIRLGEFTTHLLQNHPLLDVDIRHRNSVSALSSIRSRELDASFYLGDEVPPGIGAIRLRSVRYKMVASPAWSKKIAPEDWSTLAELPWITTPRAGGFFQMMDALVHSHGQRLKNVIEADQESAIINLVQAGAGVSLIREEVIAQTIPGDKVVIWEFGDTSSTLRAVYLQSRREEPVIQAIVEGLETVWGTQK